MTQAITLNTVEKFRALPEEKPCYAELFERIAAIWNAICTWISELFASFFNKPIVNQRDITQRSASAFYHVLNYLEPKEVARCETVCKFWKIPEKIWKARCATYGITSLPESGSYKEICKVPKMAFGPREWVKHGWGEPGPMPSLPTNIKSQVAERKDTHTLTLVPKTVNDQPLSFHTFIPVIKKSGLDLNTRMMPEEAENEVQEKSVWVWMQKNLELGTRKITSKDAEAKHKLGKAFWIVVSIVAEFAQTHICLFAAIGRQVSFTWASDHGRDPYLDHSVAIGFTQDLVIDYIFTKDKANFIGVAPAFSA